MKAKCWADHFSAPVINFTTLSDMLRMLFSAGRHDVLLFRYQNNPSKLLSALAVLAVLFFLLVKVKALGMRAVWICHNVDQDTGPHYKLIEQARRWLLGHKADAVFVLDPSFIKYCIRPDAIPISFGVKLDGNTKNGTIEQIKAMAARVDRVVLIAGQDGGKYKAFERIPQLYDSFQNIGMRAGFVTAGMSPGRSFSENLENVILRIDEPNLRESDLSNLIHFVYRENADISIPYTIYAAATAGIPVITSDDSLLAKILLREGIGLPVGMLAAEGEANYDFAGFLKRHQWSRLKVALAEIGILV